MNKNTVVSGIPYVSVWDGGVEVESTCTIDFRTGNILDIEPAKGLASFGFLDTLDREYIVLNDEQVDVMEDDEGVRWVRLEHAQREAAQNEPDDEDSEGRTFVVTEWCPNCEHEVELHGWDTDRDGFQIVCPYCGEELRLCDECTHAPDYRGCDWSAEHECYRCRNHAQKQAKETAADADGVLKVETPAGTLLAQPVIDSKFPGIAISLTRPGAEIGRMLALTEFCSGDNTDCPDFPAMDDEVITRVWGDGLNEDYTTRVVHENIEKFFEQEKTPVPMGVDKVVSGLKDLIKDRKSFIHEGDDDPYDHGDNPFRHDVAVLETAIALITGANEGKEGR